MSLSKSSMFRAVSPWLLTGALATGLSVAAAAQSEPGPPPPPPPGGPGMMNIQGPGFGGGFFHEEIGEGHTVVKGAPMTASITTTRDTTLADGNTIHTDNQTTIYRDAEGRVRREIGFELNTPTTGATKRTMVLIIDPVSGNRYLLNPQTKTARQMPAHPPKPPGAPEGEPPARPANPNMTTESLGTKAILGLQAEGTRVTRTIPAGQIGNAKTIEVVTERWVSTDLQIPLSTTHSDPMMGTMTSKVTSVSRTEPDASLFQVPSDYKLETGKSGDVFYMPAKP